MLLKVKSADLDVKDQEVIEVVKAACNAIWAVSMSFKSKLEIHKLGAIKHFRKLLQSCHEEIIISTLGIITQCAAQVFENIISNIFELNSFTAKIHVNQYFR